MTKPLISVNGRKKAVNETVNGTVDGISAKLNFLHI